MRRNTIQWLCAATTAMSLSACGTLLDSSAGYGTYGNNPYDNYGTYDPYATYPGSYDGYQSGYDAARVTLTTIAYEEARQEALFLSDKMAYELGLTAAQYAAVYEINLDYILSVGGRDDLFSTYWSRRNSDLFYVLDARQYAFYTSADYFYRPLYWANNYYAYRIYERYPVRTTFYVSSRPTVYNTYRGGHNRTAGSYYQGQFGQRTGQPPVNNNVQPGHHNGHQPGNGSWHNNGNRPNNKTGNTNTRPTTATPRPATTNVSTPTTTERPATNTQRPTVKFGDPSSIKNTQETQKRGTFGK